MILRRGSKIHARLRSIGLGVLGGALLAVLALVAWYQWTQASRPAAFQGSPSSYEGTRLDRLEGLAPGFRLLDQNGASVSLADFRGKVVVLTLLDPDCTDLCPIEAYQYRLAYQALGQDAARVAFLALNANDEKTSVEDVMAATKKWSVDEIPVWHFLTGSPEALRAVWKAYGMVASSLPKPDRPEEKAHSAANFVIDQAGRRRWYLSTNFEGAPPLSALTVKHVKELLAEGRRQ